MKLRTVFAIFAVAATIALLQLIDVGSAKADGAIAVGRCDRIGWAYGPDLGDVRRRALWQCRRNGDYSCKIVTTTVDACAAIAVSGNCGARGWATGGSRGRAEALALDACARYGGRDCSIRRWVCS
jgi:Domain of unknown function (DUF4189)